MIFWILLIYLVVAFFFPVVGWLALICMIAPVWMSVYRGRHWCGNFCPRGNFYDKVVAKISRRRKIPAFLRSVGFRVFMLLFIFTMFGVQMYLAWGDWAAMGGVFWNIIFITTVVGIVLGALYSPRAWCTFCPMGTLSSWVAPRRPRGGFRTVRVDVSCVSCRKCARECPMQLTPYLERGSAAGLLDPDCIKCGVCVGACPLHSLELK